MVYGLFREAAGLDLAGIPYTSGNQGLLSDLMRHDTDLPTSPDELAKLIRDDRAKWKPMVDLYKLRVN